MIAKARGKCLMCWGRANLKVKRRFESWQDLILNDVLIFAKRDIFQCTTFLQFIGKMGKIDKCKCPIGVWL